MRKIQSEMKHTLLEIKNNLQGNNSGMDEVESQINDLEPEEVNNQSGQQDEKRTPQNEDKVSSLWDNFKRSNIHIIGVPERKRKSNKLEICL